MPNRRCANFNDLLHFITPTPTSTRTLPPAPHNNPPPAPPLPSRFVVYFFLSSKTPSLLIIIERELIILSESKLLPLLLLRILLHLPGINRKPNQPNINNPENEVHHQKG